LKEYIASISRVEKAEQYTSVKAGGKLPVYKHNKNKMVTG
jgi:hypothetical protein